MISTNMYCKVSDDGTIDRNSKEESKTFLFWSSKDNARIARPKRGNT